MYSFIQQSKTINKLSICVSCLVPIPTGYHVLFSMAYAKAGLLSCKSMDHVWLVGWFVCFLGTRVW